jgi:murein DD-endopeptidase MepM/ murein hydrolase activator NlpD
MNHKAFYLVVPIVIGIVVACYTGVSIYLILNQSSEIKLLKNEKYSYMQKVKQLEDMIISARERGELPIPSAGEKIGKEGLPSAPLKSTELETATIDFLNTQQYIPDFLPTTNFILTKPYLPTRSHFGIDLAGKVGDPIFAAASGVVKHIEMNDKIYGKSVSIDHLDGYETFYGHNSDILVKEKFFVKKGEIIAKLGNTGRSSAPHLHFEIMFKSKHIDPESMINK